MQHAIFESAQSRTVTCLPVRIPSLKISLNYVLIQSKNEILQVKLIIQNA